jgi:hypothetical protein
MVAICVNVCIISSTLSYIYTSFPQYRVQSDKDRWALVPAGIFWNDAVCAVVFTLELALRLFSLPRLGLIVRQPGLFIDMLVLIPWYASVISGRTIQILSILRILRSVRILMIFRATKKLVSLLGGTVQRAAYMLLLLMCVITMGICLLGVALWTFERGEWDPFRRMFVRTASIACSVRCPRAAVFGAYAGCEKEGDTIMMNMGHSGSIDVHENCTVIKVRLIAVGRLHACQE